MRHIDIGGNVEIPYKKIGITGAGDATLNSRLQQISNTKSPIKAQCVAAWEYEDARTAENAIHSLLDDMRVEGEWFLDKDDTLVERLQPLMDLINANEIEIQDSDDSYTKEVMQKESISREKLHQELIGEISEQLNSPLKVTIRKSGPTFYSSEKELTYYVRHRKSGEHNFTIGRSRGVAEELLPFLENNEFDAEIGPKGGVRVMHLTPNRIAQAINIIETNFIN